MHTTHIVIVLPLLVLSTWCAPSRAQAGLEVDQPSKICVIVESIPPDAARLGVTTDAVRTRVELRLRESGLALCTEPKPQYLYVRVDALPGAFSIDAQFKRRVDYAYDGRTLSVFASTWSKAYLGRNLALVVQTLDQALDAFLNDYHKANR